MADVDTQIIVRSLTRDELKLLASLWKAAGLSYRPLGRDRDSMLADQWDSDASGFIGAFDHGALIGSVLATDDGRRGWINRLAVLPSHRHRGLGHRLIKAAEEVLKDRGLLIIAALIEDANQPSRNLFSTVGYDLLPEVLYYSKRESPDA